MKISLDKQMVFLTYAEARQVARAYGRDLPGKHVSIALRENWLGAKYLFNCGRSPFTRKLEFTLEF